MTSRNEHRNIILKDFVKTNNFTNYILLNKNITRNNITKKIKNKFHHLFNNIPSKKY